MQRAIQALDVARRSLTLTVKQGAVLDETRVEHQLSGDVRVGRDAHIALPSHSTGDGGEVTVSRGNSAGASRLQYRSERINPSKRDETTQVQRVLDGQSAFIRIGQAAPSVQNTCTPGDKHVVHASGMHSPEFFTGFEVLPRVNGDRVHLEITPRLSTPHDPAVGRVNFQEIDHFRGGTARRVDRSRRRGRGKQRRHPRRFRQRAPTRRRTSYRPDQDRIITNNAAVRFQPRSFRTSWPAGID